MWHDAIQQRPFNLKILGNSLDDPVALFQLRQIVFKVPGVIIAASDAS